MPFNSAIANQAARRLSGYSARQFALFCPNTVVFRCQPSAASTEPSYAQFGYGSVSVGAFGDVKEGQAVIISTDTAMRNVLFRGRVRKTPTASVFYINQTSFKLETSYFVSVINTYDIVERLERITSDKQIFKDFDLTFQRLPPVITNLQSVYISNTTSATASFSFAPTAQAMSSGATISSWLWNVEDGTITTGSTTTQNITVSFPAGYRWVILRVTDSNGVSNRFCFEVWVGNADSTSAGQLIRSTEGFQVTGNWSEGWNASFELFAEANSFLDQTRVTLFSLHTFGNGTTSTTVDFVGYLTNEAAQLRGDETNGQIKLVQLQAQGFASILGQLKAPTASINNTNVPAQWGDIISPTPARVASYVLTMHTTAANLCALQWFASDSSFITDDLYLEEPYIIDAVNAMLSRYNAELTFSPSGEIKGARNACYLSSSDRNSLTTIVNLTTDDWLDIQLDTIYRYPVGSILMPAIVFNTSTNQTIGYTGKAPAVVAFTSGEEQIAPRQVLASNLTPAQAEAEVSLRAANHFGYINNRETVRLSLVDSYSDLVPTNDQWVTITLSASDNPRGTALTSSNRWLLQDVSYSSSSFEGVRTVEVTLIAETSDTGAQIVTTRIPAISELDVPAIPPNPYPFTDLDYRVNMPDDDPSDFDLGNLDWGDLGNNDPYPPAITNNGNPMCFILPVFFNNPTAVTTPFNTVFGKTYTITVQGVADIGTAAGVWEYVWDFTASNGSFSPNLSTSRTPQENGVWTSGTGWQAQTNVLNSNPNDITRTVSIFQNFGSTAVTGASFTYNLTKGTISNNAFPNGIYRNGGVYLTSINRQTDTDGTNKLATWSGSQTITSIGFVSTASANTAGSTTGTTVIRGATLSGNGSLPTLAGGSFVTTPTAARGDAFYSITSAGVASAYSGSQGLELDANQVSIPAPYNPNAQYTFTTTGTGAPFGFRMAYSSYTGVQNLPLIVTICPRE